MSKITIALETAVSAVIQITTLGQKALTLRQRVSIDTAFTLILKLIAPRIRHFIRQYGLVAHWEDAEQCCAIAVHRAIHSYDPTKAQFTTFVNWQIRGELQGLRFRLMADQRPSAQKVSAATVSLHAVITGADGEERTLEATIEDENALTLTESAASNYLANAATASLVDEFIAHQRLSGFDQLHKRPKAKRPAVDPALRPVIQLNRSRGHGLDAGDVAKLELQLVRDRKIVERRVFDAVTLDELGLDAGVTKERVRQITKRASKTITDLAANHPRFAMMAAYREPGPLPVSRRRKNIVEPVIKLKVPALIATSTGILPALEQSHNMLSCVHALDFSPIAISEPYIVDAVLDSVGSPSVF